MRSRDASMTEGVHRVERIGNATLYLGDCLQVMPTLARELAEAKAKYLLLSQQHSRLCDQVYEADGETLNQETLAAAQKCGMTAAGFCKWTAPGASATEATPEYRALHMLCEDQEKTIFELRAAMDTIVGEWLHGGLKSRPEEKTSPDDKMLLRCNACQKSSWVLAEEWTKMPSGGTWIRCPHCNVPINKLEDAPSFAHGTPERIALERLYNEEITVAKAIELLREAGIRMNSAPAPEEKSGLESFASFCDERAEYWRSANSVATHVVQANVWECAAIEARNRLRMNRVPHK